MIPKNGGDMRYLFIALLLTWLSPMQAIAENKPSAEAAAQEGNVFVGYLYKTEGEVAVSIDDQMTQAVSSGAPLKNDTTITTGENSRAILKFNDGQIIALQANTSFRILNYHYNPKEVEKSNLFFYMLKGGLRAITGLVARTRPDAFRMETRGTTIGVRGTDFMAVLDDQLYLQVTSGAINAGNRAGAAVLKAGQSAAVASENTLPILIKADELPRGIFSRLSEISMPEPTPIEFNKPSQSGATRSAPAEPQKPLWAPNSQQLVSDYEDPAEAQAEKEVAKKQEGIRCERYGLQPGTLKYQLCIEYGELMK